MGKTDVIAVAATQVRDERSFLQFASFKRIVMLLES